MVPKPAGFDDVFATLKQVFRRHLDRLSVQADSATEYTLVGRKPSPFPQHKGHPMFFSSAAWARRTSASISCRSI